MSIFKKKTNGQGIILINGFSTASNDYISLYPYLTSFSEIALIHFPSDMDENNQKVDVRYDIWLKNTLQQIKLIQEKVINLTIIGFSSGAIPACYFAQVVGADQLILMSPVFRYQSFDEGVEKVVASIRSNLVNKFNPISTLLSLKHVGSFLKNPLRNWKALAKINTTPLTSPQTILLFPLLSFYEEELTRIDNTVARISEWALDQRNDEELHFVDTTKSPVGFDQKQDKQTLFKTMLKQVAKVLPNDFKQLTSQNVLNILQLLSFCDKHFTEVKCPTLLFAGLEDEALKDVEMKKITKRIRHPNCRIVYYPISEHNLFGSLYSKEICEAIIEFTKKKKTAFSFWKRKKESEEEEKR